MKGGKEHLYVEAGTHEYLGPKDTKSLEAAVVVATYEAMGTQE
jgi:hypothetical protein